MRVRTISFLPQSLQLLSIFTLAIEIDKQHIHGFEPPAMTAHVLLSIQSNPDHDSYRIETANDSTSHATAPSPMQCSSNCQESHSTKLITHRMLEKREIFTHSRKMRLQRRNKTLMDQSEKPYLRGNLFFDRDQTLSSQMQH